MSDHRMTIDFTDSTGNQCKIVLKDYEVSHVIEELEDGSFITKRGLTIGGQVVSIEYPEDVKGLSVDVRPDVRVSWDDAFTKPLKNHF